MEREEKLMKSNKWKFLLTGVATLTLLTACTQAYLNQLQQTIPPKQPQLLLQIVKQIAPTILQIRTRTLRIMKYSLYCKNCLDLLQLFQGTA